MKDVGGGKKSATNRHVATTYFVSNSSLPSRLINYLFPAAPLLPLVSIPALKWCPPLPATGHLCPVLLDLLEGLQSLGLASATVPRRKFRASSAWQDRSELGVAGCASPAPTVRQHACMHPSSCWRYDSSILEHSTAGLPAAGTTTACSQASLAQEGCNTLRLCRLCP